MANSTVLDSTLVSSGNDVLTASNITHMPFVNMTSNITHLPYVNKTSPVPLAAPDALMSFSTWYAGYHGYASVTVCAVGIVCNVFNILVLTRRNMLSPTNYMLTALALADMLTMVSYVPFAVQFYLAHGLTPSPERNTREWIYFFLVHVNFTVTTHTISIWLGVLLAVFRYSMVRGAASRNSRATSMKQAQISILGIWLAAPVTLLPNYLSLRVISVEQPPLSMEAAVLTIDTNTSEFIGYGTSTRANMTLYYVDNIDTLTEYGHVMTTVNFWIHAVLIKIIPCALMSIFCALLVWTMRASHRKRRQMRAASAAPTNGITAKRASTRSRDHSRTTAMLVAVVVLFLVTELPQGVLAMCSGLLPGFFEAYYMPLGDAMDIVALVNNAINFALYCSMSKQFRQTFLRLFMPKMKASPRTCSVTVTYNQVSQHYQTPERYIIYVNSNRKLFLATLTYKVYLNTFDLSMQFTVNFISNNLLIFAQLYSIIL